MKVIVKPNSKTPIRGILAKPFTDEKEIDLTEMQIKRALGFSAKVYIRSLDGIKAEIKLDRNGNLDMSDIKNTLEEIEHEVPAPVVTEPIATKEVPQEKEEEPKQEQPQQHMTKAQRRAARREAQQKAAEETAKKEEVTQEANASEDEAKENAEILEQPSEETTEEN